MNKQLKNKYNQLEQTEIIMSQSPTKQPTPLQRSKRRVTNFNETFDSSIIHRQEKFALDKTLVKGIKQNDPSKIVQNGEEADLGQTANLYDEHQEISDVLVNTRKKYDHFKETSNRTEDRIQKLKKQKQKLNDEKAKIEANYSNEQMEYKKIQAYLQNINGNCDACQYTKEVYTQISQTLKQDILFFKKNCFQANIKIVRNTNKIKSLSGQYESYKKVSTNCKSLIYSIEKKIHSKQTERYDKLNSYHEIINKKIENNEKRQERERMIEGSMLEALNGKMPEQQEQRKVLAVNLALKKMLKLKMEREMQKFGDIQNTFRKIKQHTTVKRADQFIERFINRQKHYGELLESISKSEQRIAFLKQQKQRLNKQNQQIMYDKQTIQDKELQRQKRLSQDVIVKMDEVRNKLIHNETLKNKAFAFVSKFMAAFDKISIDQAKRKLSKDKPNLMLLQTLERVNKFLDAVQKQQSEQKLKQIFIQSKDLTLPEKVKERNLRIKTLSTREDTTSSAMQDHDVAYDDLSQIQYLNHARKHIKKSEYLRNRLKTKAY